MHRVVPSRRCIKHWVNLLFVCTLLYAMGCAVVERSSLGAETDPTARPTIQTVDQGVWVDPMDLAEPVNPVEPMTPAEPMGPAEPMDAGEPAKP